MNKVETHLWRREAAMTCRRLALLEKNLLELSKLIREVGRGLEDKSNQCQPKLLLPPFDD